MLGLQEVTYLWSAKSGSLMNAAAQDNQGIQGLSFSLNSGERVALIGPNGSGKSTILKLAAGILKPNCGTCVVDDVELQYDDESLRAHYQKVGYVGQDPDDQIVASTVFEEVAFGPCNLGIPISEVQQRVTDALEKTNLSDKSGFEVSALSGGELQRLALAGVLAMRPRYLLLDEPFSMLDYENRRALIEITHGLSDEGIGVLLVTHEIEDVLGFDRVIVVCEGQVVWNGSPLDLLRDQEALHRSRCLVSKWSELAGDLAQMGILDNGSLRDSPETCALKCGRLATRHPVGECVEHPNGTRDKGMGAYGSVDSSGECCNPSRQSWDLARGASLEASNLRLCLKAGGAIRQILDDVSLEITRGAVVLVLGETGAGKTTLIETLSGLEPPDYGMVTIGGRKIAPGDVGCSFQYAYEQFFASTVLEEVMFGPLNLGLSKAEAESLAKDALVRLGCEPDLFEGRNPYSLSGGQARRISLAGVLAMDPPFVFLDEPTVGLDADGVESFSKIVSMLREEGRGVLIASHDVERLLPLADIVFCMLDGSLDLVYVTRGARDGQKACSFPPMDDSDAFRRTQDEWPDIAWSMNSPMQDFTAYGRFVRELRRIGEPDSGRGDC